MEVLSHKSLSTEGSFLYPRRPLPQGPSDVGGHLHTEEHALDSEGSQTALRNLGPLAQEKAQL